jgi:hypothetical protein
MVRFSGADGDMRARAGPLLLGLTMLGALALPSRAFGQEPAATPARPDAQELEARERHAILVVRTLALAGKTYAAANGSLFGELGCLTNPASCRGSWPEDAPFPLDPSYDWEGVKLGYRRRFHPGPRASDEEALRTGAARGSLKAFAYTAAPELPGQSGLRAFCADSSGRFCVTPDGREPTVKNGRCDPCKKLE